MFRLNNRRPSSNGRLWWREPRSRAWLLVLVLAGANVVTAVVSGGPWRSSSEQLLRRQSQLERQLRERRKAVDQLEQVLARLDQARAQHHEFVNRYLIDRSEVASATLAELKRLADQSGLKLLEHTFEVQPVEGSQNLATLAINGNYRGNYSQLVRFVELLDRSDKLLILDTLTASPEQSSQELKINAKLYAFAVDRAGVAIQPIAQAQAGQAAASVGGVR